MFDFIVVGAGIAGAAVAYELSQSARVALIEKEARGGIHATGRSAALYIPSYGGVQIRALTRASRQFFDDTPQEFGDRPILNHRGCLYIARADQLDLLSKTIDEIRSSSGYLDEVGAEGAQNIVPLLRQGYVAGAALDADAMDMDVAALHQGFLKGGKTQGVVSITHTDATRIRRRGNIWQVDMDTSPIRAPILINAAGAWADEIAIACGARPLGFTPLRRTAAIVDAPDNFDISEWPAVIDVAENFYFKPDAGKLLISLADETLDVPRDVQPEDLDVATAIDRVQSAIHLDVRRAPRAWAGLRTFSADRDPVIGFDSDTPGLFWSAGQGGYGIQTAPAWARTAAALARGELIPSDVAAEGVNRDAISPVRFAGR